LSDHDVLGNALLNMRGNLARVAEEGQKAVTGLQKGWLSLVRYSEAIILTSKKLTDEIIGNLVKYFEIKPGRSVHC